MNENDHFDELDLEEVTAKILATPPPCIRDFTSVPAESPEKWDHAAVVTSWRLSCRCCAEIGAFLGYPLKQYNREYNGPEFISPLGFRCSTCGAETEILDTDRHGYHAEIGSTSAVIRGEGARDCSTCSHCQSTEFRLTVVFLYWDFDLIEDEPELLPKAEVFFNEFVAYGHCDKCGRLSRFTDFGKL